MKEHVYTDKEVIKLAENEIQSLRSELSKKDEEIKQLREALKELVNLVDYLDKDGYMETHYDRAYDKAKSLNKP